MNYTVTVNEAKKEIKVMLDGYEGVAKCCPTDNFNLGTGIELALERARVAKADANKPKTEMSVSEAIKVLENYVGNHIAIIGGGDHMSESQNAELRAYADRLAPVDKCCDCCDCDCCDYDEDEDEIVEDEDEIVEDELDEVSELAARMILRIREILEK